MFIHWKYNYCNEISNCQYSGRTGKQHISKMTTDEIEDLLPAHLFKRNHRSFIVSVSKIESYTAEMVEVNGVSIPIGRGYRDVIENL